jgi:HEAT repeat protein
MPREDPHQAKPSPEVGPGQEELRAALSGDRAARHRALDLLLARAPEARAAAIDGAGAQALVDLLASESRSEQRSAADRLAAIAADSQEVVAALRAALCSPGQRLRWGAAYTLGRAGHADASLWPAAREAMALPDGDQRWAAAELAGAIARRDAAALDELARALDDPNPVLRRMCLYCLRDLGSATAAPSALRSLEDPDTGVRLAALAALPVLLEMAATPETSAAAESIARILAGDPDAGVRRSAAVALGRFPSANAAVRAALERAAGDADSSLARAATAALARLASTREPPSGRN